MSRKTRIVAATLAALLGGWFLFAHPFVSYETQVDYLVIAAAIPATIFVLAYPILQPKFWRSWIGRALWTSSLGLATLLDLTLAAKWFQWVAPREVLTVILVIIAAGAWLKVVALFRQAWLQFRVRHGDESALT